MEDGYEEAEHDYGRKLSHVTILVILVFMVYTEPLLRHCRGLFRLTTAARIHLLSKPPLEISKEHKAMTNTGPENMRGLDLSTPLRLIEPPPFEKESSHGDDCTEDLGDWTVMMVTMEDCEDQTITDEPTPEQTDVHDHDQLPQSARWD